jgi:exopolysaccharide production protein ExoY
MLSLLAARPESSAILNHRWLNTKSFLKAEGNKKRVRIMDRLRSREEIGRLLLRERAACDRHAHELSVLVLDTAGPEVIDTLIHRIREIDEVGWFTDRAICVILPYTSSAGAQKFVDDIAQRISRPPDFRIYTYPGQWPEATRADRAGSVLPFQNLITTPIPAWKRTLDVTASALGLFLLLPLLLIVAGVIKLSSPGPALLRQRRVGRHGKPFTLWKFRTMRLNADAGVHQDHLKTLITSDKPMTKLDVDADPRIFPAGKFIRRCYLDELPQLINVLRGEMSLVGPRPCLPYEAQQYKQWHRGRFQAAPGMTGLWQVSGKNRTTFAQMIRLDIAYAQRMSFLLDIRILLKTLPAILSELMDRVARRRLDATQHVNAGAVRKNS